MSLLCVRVLWTDMKIVVMLTVDILSTLDIKYSM